MPDLTDAVRTRAEDVCDALVAGDVERVIGELSDELKRNVGEVMALLPLPAVEAGVESVERGSGGSAYLVVLQVVGETDQTQIQTRWKDRGGTPKIVEVSHLSRTERPEEAEPAEATEAAESRAE